MDLTYTTVLFLAIIQISLCGHEDTMFVQPFDLRSANTFPVMAQFPSNTHFVPQQPQHMIIHTNNQPFRVPTLESPRSENSILDEFIEAFNEASQQNENDDQFRAAGRDESSYSYSHPPSYGYPTGSNYGPVAPTSYHKPSTYTPPAIPAPAKIPLLKPDLLDLVKPVTTKVTGKMNGLVGLVLSLLTGAVPGGLQLKGFKDLFINGILKPLFVVKGGIKALVAKLAIPVISLLLINLEVLITVWWLWEECPEKITSYPDKPSPDYNSYS